MANQSQFDYIIVGQGIAGSVLAYSLLKENKKIMVIDEPSLSCSSKIAAGLYNPVVFKRLVKSWKADQVLPFADFFYKEIESFFHKEIYFKKPIIKIFSEENEKDFWIKKTESDVGKYLSKKITKEYVDQINSPLGSAEVKESGYLDVALFLHLIRNYIKETSSIIEEKFEYSYLNISNNQIKYRNTIARKIIFCEGFKATENPFFNWLPFKLTKGEILILRINNFNPEQVINKGVFILPLGEDLFKVGATYEWNDLNEQPSARGKSELIEKLSAVLKIPFTVVDHKAGIRPTVNDRRPLIGLHPKHNEIGIFNGMGTKGVMLSPYFAKQFVDYLEKNLSLDKEVDINRFN